MPKAALEGKCKGSLPWSEYFQSPSKLLNMFEKLPAVPLEV